MAEKRSSRTFAHQSVEFGRVVAFSDGLFAIAMTLLVVGITVPAISDNDSVGELADALNELSSSVVSFFISFAVIGRYWIAHHSFFSGLKAIDSTLISINLLYLAFIAFLPFPTALLGAYFENPLAIVIYAPCVAMISGLEVVLFRHAHRSDLLRRKLPPDVYRFGVTASLTPVVFFLLSVPLAFVDTGIAVASWFLTIPFAFLADRFKPDRADQLLR